MHKSMICGPSTHNHGFCEEIFWRGIFVKLFPENPWLGIVYPAVGFALWHFLPQNVFPADNVSGFVLSTLFLGLAYGAIAYRTGSAKWTAISHSLNGILALSGMIAFGMQHPQLAMKMMPDMTPDAFKKQAARLDTLGIPTTNWFVDAYYNNASSANMISILRQLPPGVSEMMVHPGLDDLNQKDPSAYSGRSREFEVMTDPAVRDALLANHIQRIDFTFLSRSSK